MMKKANKNSEYYTTLKVLKKSSPEVAREIIRYAPHGLIDLLSKSAKTILEGRCRRSKGLKGKYRKLFTELSDNNKSCATYKKKKRIILQKGGMLRKLFDIARDGYRSRNAQIKKLYNG